MTDTEKISASTLARIESANRIKKQESMEEYAGKSLSTKEADELWKKIQADKKKDASIMKAEKQRRIRAKNKAKPMGKATGGHVKSSAETSVIKGAKAKGSAQGSTIPGAPAKGSAEGSVIPMKMNSGGLAKRGYGKASAEPLYSKKKEADFEKGIYSYVKHKKTPSSTHHKEMIDREKVKYKGLTNKQIVAKAMKSGNIKKLKSTESKKSQRIKKKTIDDYKQGGIIKMNSGGAAIRGYGKARR